jgi:putative hemolysin
MEYSVKDKLEWIVVFVLEFGRRYDLDMRQAFNYLSRYKAISYLDEYYGYAHTQSFATMVNEMTEYCQRHGGEIGLAREERAK